MPHQQRATATTHLQWTSRDGSDSSEQTTPSWSAVLSARDACEILSAMVDIDPGGLGGAYGLRGGRAVPNTRSLLLSAALRGRNSVK